MSTTTSRLQTLERVMDELVEAYGNKPDLVLDTLARLNVEWREVVERDSSLFAEVAASRRRLFGAPSVKRIYLAGPMSGIDAFNYPLFFAESDRLHKLGYSVENPAANPEQADWASYLRVALTQMLTCEGVALLPGWERSRGACLEVHVAEALGMPVVEASAIDLFAWAAV